MPMRIIWEREYVLTELQLPQLIANYKAKSAEALSMKFLFIWLLGDICNLSGPLPPTTPLG